MSSHQTKYVLFLVAMLAGICNVATAQRSYCKPCLWYAGDFDSNDSNANGMADEKDILVEDATVSVPFTVPKGKVWKITGALGLWAWSNLILDPAQVDWSFAKGVRAGHAGKRIKAGTSSATYVADSCLGSEAVCVTIVTKGISVTLTEGRYWMTLVPYCTNSHDQGCTDQRYFLMDVEDKPPHNHYGPKNVLDASYATSKQFGYYYAPTWGSSGTCSGSGCDAFSVGLIGTSEDATP